MIDKVLFIIIFILLGLISWRLDTISNRLGMNIMAVQNLQKQLDELKK